MRLFVPLLMLLQLLSMFGVYALIRAVCRCRRRPDHDDADEATNNHDNIQTNLLSDDDQVPSWSAADLDTDDMIHLDKSDIRDATESSTSLASHLPSSTLFDSTRSLVGRFAQSALAEQLRSRRFFAPARLVRTSVALVLLSYSTVLSSCLAMLNCFRLGQSAYLHILPSVPCSPGSSEYSHGRTVATTVLLPYLGLVVVLTFGFLLVNNQLLIDNKE